MMPRPNLVRIEGPGEVLLLDKPMGWSSFDVVRKVRSILSVRKVGHAGTLDPLATGLLIVATEGMTKSLERFALEEKEYRGSFELGVRTPSFDSETEVTERRDYSGLSRADIVAALQRRVGRGVQVPPMYSAAKFGGRPLYRYARKGRTVVRAERDIEIRSFELDNFIPPIAEFSVVCSKGTYVRSLVDDVGTELGCGATLRSLRRMRIGSFRIEDAMSVEELIARRGSRMHAFHPVPA